MAGGVFCSRPRTSRRDEVAVQFIAVSFDANRRAIRERPMPRSAAFLATLDIVEAACTWGCYLGFGLSSCEVYSDIKALGWFTSSYFRVSPRTVSPLWLL